MRCCCGSDVVPRSLVHRVTIHLNSWRVHYAERCRGIIRRNPCRIKGAGQEQSAERPVLTIAEVYDLAAAIDPRYRALVLLGTFASLRWAELAALRPIDIDLDACTIRVVHQLIEQLGGGSAFGPPKSRAGRRTVPFPDMLKAELADHLQRPGLDDDEALVFTSPMGAPLRHSNFYRRVWMPALAKAGLPGIHFHDRAMPGTPSPPMPARACAN
jgi:integrase